MSGASALLPNAGLGLSSNGLDAVHAMMMNSLRKTSLAPLIDELSDAIIGGKMLRARLSLKVGSATGAPHDNLLRAAAAVEMVHAASLLHDDVIDGGLLRRGVPSFWKKKSVSGAILLGDLLVCKAIQLLDGKEHGRLSILLVRLAGEMCDAEAEQELVTVTREASWEKSVAIARRKTGSLFAFAAAAAAGSDATPRSGDSSTPCGAGFAEQGAPCYSAKSAKAAAFATKHESLRPSFAHRSPDSPRGRDEGGSTSGKRAEALLEAGYRIGTAYQLADDILDASGIPVGDGKDLGKDALKEKLTSASASGSSAMPAREHISRLCADSSQLLLAWPSVREAWDEYVRNNLGPVVELFTGERINGHVLTYGRAGNG